MVAVLKEPKRTLINCREAAEILGCTMGRVRQMARGEGKKPPTLWSHKATDRALLFDARQVKQLAEARRRARDAGQMKGPPPGGFEPDT